MFETTQKTIAAAVISAVFATNYGAVRMYDSYSDTQKEKIRASELRDEEAEQIQQMNLLVEECEPVKKVLYRRYSKHV